MKKLFFLAALCVATACHLPVQAYTFSGGNAPSPGTAQAPLDSLLASYILHEGRTPVHSIQVYAENESSGHQYHHATGVVGRDNTPVTKDYQYNVASITKPVVAAVILQLQEEGKLSLDDKVADYVSGISYLHFDSLHMMGNEAMSRQITIDMLLSHTSGLADIFTDAGMRFNRSLLQDPQQGFSPEKLASLYYAYGLNRRPANAPGKGFHYSDINYNLLGHVIEKVTGQSLAGAIRERILMPLGMEHTYFEYYEPAVSEGHRADAYYYDMNITQNVNTSYEWGGGGLVSTTRDMATFMKGLMSGRLFREDSTLDKMMDTSLTDAYGADYGRGLFRYRLPGPDGERVLYGHSGFFGSELAYDPAARVVIATNVNQASPPFATFELVGKILDRLYK